MPMLTGQWSPANPEGKKQYDREFLLKLQANPESRKPPLLPDMPEIMVDVSTCARTASFSSVWRRSCGMFCHHGGQKVQRCLNIGVVTNCAAVVHF